jgi:hypothetical protein
MKIQYPQYSAEWVGQDGNRWREVTYEIGAGHYRRFLQRFIGGEWQGW